MRKGTRATNGDLCDPAYATLKRLLIKRDEVSLDSSGTRHRPCDVPGTQWFVPGTRPSADFWLVDGLDNMTDPDLTRSRVYLPNRQTEFIFQHSRKVRAEHAALHLYAAEFSFDEK